MWEAKTGAKSVTYYRRITGSARRPPRRSCAILMGTRSDDHDMEYRGPTRLNFYLRFARANESDASET